MIELQDYEYEVGGVVIGNDRTREIFAEDVTIGAAEWITQDQDNPVGDGIAFGRDRLRGPTWTFALVIACDTEAQARAALEQLAQAWRARETSRTPGASIPMRYRIGGLTRRVYGRPRNFAIDDWAALSQGTVTVSAQFDTKDAKGYSDTREEITVTLLPMEAGGLTGELSGNLQSQLTVGSRQGLVTVGGAVDTPAIVTFRGPVSNPRIYSTGWSIGLRGDIAFDESVTVESRDNTVIRSDGAGVAGMLSRQTYLNDVRLQPGAQEIIFEGTDLTGSATATVQWETAFESQI